MEEFNLATLGKRSMQGVIALVSKTFFLQSISFTASLIVFTILSPSDIGIYTAVIAFQRIINFFTDFGFGAALIQKKDHITDEDISTSFTIQFLATLFIFIIILVVHLPITTLLKLNEAGGRLLLALVFSIFLSSFKTIPSILLERNIEFRKLVIPQIVEAIVFNSILIILILKGFGIDSYSIAFISSCIVGIPIYFYIAPWKIRLGIHKESLRHLKYGIAFQTKNILATMKDDFLTVFLVKFLSFTEIGYIGFAQRWAFFVFRYIVDSVTKVTFPAYSRIQHDAKLLRVALEKSLFFVSASITPLLVGLMITAPYLIRYFPKWEGKWEPALVSIIFFSLNALVSSFSGILVNTLDATGKVKTTLKLMTIWTILTWTITPVLIYMIGYNGVAIASFIITLTIGYTIIQVKKVVQFEFIKSIYKPIIASSFMGVVVFLLTPFFAKDMFSLLFVILIGGMIYAGGLYLLGMNELRENIKLVFAKS